MRMNILYSLYNIKKWFDYYFYLTMILILIVQ